jgi:hypothetical protein
MSIKNVKPSFKSGYRQGYYKPKRPEKYIGDPENIIFRSSWEYRFCKYCDDNEVVVKWSSEPTAIKYINPIDNQEHNYYVDFFLRIKRGEKEIGYLAEIKPEASLEKPIMESGSQTVKRLKNYNYAMQTWIINRAKFHAAKQFAENNGYRFVIVTEKFLFENDKSNGRQRRVHKRQ